ncbi:AEC family transporter [Guggenheimella bovis]
MLLDNFLLGVQVVIPVFILIGIGFLLKQFKFLSEEALTGLNDLVFTVLLPANLFYSISRSDLKSVFNLPMVLVACFFVTFTFFFGMFLMKRVEPEGLKRGVMVQAMVRGNFVILGFPILTAIYDPSAIDRCAVLLVLSMPLYNAFSVIALESAKGQKEKSKIFSNILKNPLILGTIVGFLFIPIPVPDLIMKPLSMLGNISSPLALLTLGASLELSGLRDNRKRLAFISFYRLLLIPFLVLLVGLLIGFEERVMMTLMVFMAAPTAVFSFTMTKKIGGDIALSQQIILATTVLSLFSYVGWIFAVKSLFV